MEETKVNRRNEWFAMGAFSIVALVSITSEMSGDLSDQEDELKWSIVSLIIGVGVAGIGFFAHALGELFVGTIIEGLLVRNGRVVAMEQFHSVAASPTRSHLTRGF